MWNWLPPLEKEWIPFWAAVIAFGGVALTALNAWAVAWFNARASRQLAVDTAHRELRRKVAEKGLVLLHKLKFAAEDLHEALATGQLERARELSQVTPAVLGAWKSELREGGEDWEVTDSLMKDAFMQAIVAAGEMVNMATNAIADFEQLTADQRKDDAGIRNFLSDMDRRSVRLDNLADAAELAAEAYIFNLRRLRREARRRLKA
jgi:hypothetical protein